MAKTAARKQAGRRGSAKRKTARAGTPRTGRKIAAARSAATRRRRERRPPKAPSKARTAATAARGVLAGAVTAVVDRLPWTDEAPDAIQLLEREHRRFEELLAEGESTTERAAKRRRHILQTLTSELNAHELMEEKVLYPALQSHPETRAVVLEGYEEHHIADVIVDELHAVAADDEQWAAKFKVLKENIEHHIQEEERQMFRLARGIVSRDELRELAVRMAALRGARSGRRAR